MHPLLGVDAAVLEELAKKRDALLVLPVLLLELPVVAANVVDGGPSAFAATALAMAIVVPVALVLKGLEGGELVVVNLDVVRRRRTPSSRGGGVVIVELDGAARVEVVAGRAEDDARATIGATEMVRAGARDNRAGEAAGGARARAPAPARSDG